MSNPVLLQTGESEDFSLGGDLEPEDDLDAFNDETFGGEADEWQESAHEELAELTEQERKALVQFNDFFEFGSDDGEPLEPSPAQNGSSASHAKNDARLAGGEAGHSHHQQQSDAGHAAATVGVPGLAKQFAHVRLETAQVQSPLSIQTSLPIQTSVPVNHVVYPSHVVPGPYNLPTHQVAYNLVPPAHFQAAAPAPPADPLQDPAIMSFSKLPQTQLPHNAGVGHSLAPQQFQQVPIAHNFPPTVAMQQPQQQARTNLFGQSQPTNMSAMGVMGNPSDFARSHPQPHQHHGHAHHQIQQSQQQPRPPGSLLPPSVMGYKTMQDVENEMLYGIRSESQAPPSQPPPPTAGGHASSRSGSTHNYPPPQRQQQQHQAQQHQVQQQQHHAPMMNQQHQQQQHQLLNRNLNYPGMRDRQNHHQVFANVNSRDNYHQSRHSSDGSHQNHHHQDHTNNRNNGGDRFNNHHHHNQQQSRHHHHHNKQDSRDWDDHQHQQQQQQQQQHDSWRWNEVARNHNNNNNQRNRDSATRKDLMPGHVHVLGILRHSRSSRGNTAHHHDRGGDLDDDCLGNEAPLVNPTGDPVLDAKLMEEQAELASRCRYFNETEDEYSGLMSSRDKQFIINIQLSQLKCENPYVDDYYYTMYTAKKQDAEDPESTGQMLLTDNMDQHDTEYIPTQFENSLGKLQCVTVKAPRQIIDVGVVRCRETNSPSVDETPVNDHPGLTVVKDKRSADYKGMLLQLERIYTTLLDIESLKLKLAAIPTGAPLREQVTLDLTRQIQTLVSALNKPGIISQYLQVRKGRGLLARSLKHLPVAATSKVCQEMLQSLWMVCREKTWVESIWGHLFRTIAQSSLSSLEAAMLTLVRGKEAQLNCVLTSMLGVSTVLAVLYRATTAAKRGQEKISVPAWRELILKVIGWNSSPPPSQTAAGNDDKLSLAPPLVMPQPLDIGFLLTLPKEKLQEWDAFLANVGLEGALDKC